MSWNQTMLLAAAQWPAGLAIFFIACCRLNAMPQNTRWPVVVEYAIWAAVGISSLLLPLIGDWPSLGSMAILYALLVILLCSSRAWAGDVAPDEATDVGALHLSRRQRFELWIGTTRAKVLAAWHAMQFWKV